MSHYLQQETGAFKSVQASDVTFGTSVAIPLNYSLVASTGTSSGGSGSISCSSTSAFTIVAQSTSGPSTGVFLASAWGTFAQSNGAQHDMCFCILDASSTTISTRSGYGVVTTYFSTTSVPQSISLTAIITNPTSNISVGAKPNTSTIGWPFFYANIGVAEGVGCDANTADTGITVVQIG